MKARIKYVFDRIEAVGSYAGESFIEKLDEFPGEPTLWEVKVELGNYRVRIFGALAPGGRLCLITIRRKKKQRFSTGELRAVQKQVREGMAAALEGDC